jgi:hypothetical protein
MKSVLDNSLVGVALLTSAVYAISALGPRALRRRLLAFLGRLTARVPRYLGLGRIAQRFAAAATGKAQGACGGCDNCGSEPAASDPKSPASEVRVPVEKIGRRA